VPRFGIPSHNYCTVLYCIMREPLHSLACEQPVSSTRPGAARTPAALPPVTKPLNTATAKTKSLLLMHRNYANQNCSVQTSPVNSL
jgi:hypothetical protein